MVDWVSLLTFIIICATCYFRAPISCRSTIIRENVMITWRFENEVIRALGCNRGKLERLDAFGDGPFVNKLSIDVLCSVKIKRKSGEWKYLFTNQNKSFILWSKGTTRRKPIISGLVLWCILLIEWFLRFVKLGEKRIFMSEVSLVMLWTNALRGEFLN